MQFAVGAVDRCCDAANSAFASAISASVAGRERVSAASHRAAASAASDPAPATALRSSSMLLRHSIVSLVSIECVVCGC